jgi:molybdopterin molybdotransferase
MSRDEPVRMTGHDVRLHGFSELASAEEAMAWVDANAERLPAETVATGDAPGRVLHSAIQATADLPDLDRAAEDGYAVRSRETIGAAAYNPLVFALQEPGTPLGPAGAALTIAGAPLPRGADAVLPFSAAHRDGAGLEVLAAVAEGSGVERRSHELRTGASLVNEGRALRPQDVGLLAALGVENVQAVRRPRVRLVIAGPKRSTELPPGRDADGPMLHALVARDGGAVEGIIVGANERGAIARALAAPGADAILVAGRTGTGGDDEAPLALAEVGDLAIHGIALRPGGSTGMGRVGAVPVVLLPGAPLACLCAYELLAGRLVRRLAGRNPRLPHPVRGAEIGRKIVSAVGFVDVCRVRLVDGRAEPLGLVEEGGLTSTVRADGFIVVPSPLEGHAPGARVRVHLYGGPAS